MSSLTLATTLVILIDIVLLCAFGYVFINALRYRPRFRLFTKPPKKILTLRDVTLRERWARIVRKIDYGSYDSMKIAIIDADKMVDDVLKRIGILGQHTADRIAQIDQDTFPSLKALWRAHRLRNTVVHDPSFAFRESDARLALAGYEAFLREVGVL